ncbi:precorrin-2 dehydrogenase/sirohydrochlorin ferrochelatase family protein [Sulfuricurvum sp.]|uniref:precorrin-2 dehydrogenase/sirohydrochlorin ferrochelatase family protein n=1 Tax=Sulfuricurvum sp. TaxID=2025608 RepID=UPI003BB5B0FC
MALFPMFVDLKDQDCVVIGAGEVALRKIEQLVKFSPALSVIAPEIHPEIRTLAKKYPITLIERKYELSDCEGRFLVIGALDDLGEQEKIYHTCMMSKTPVNCVDSPSLCSFIFPALIIDGDLCVGINTAGRAPAVSSALRKFLTSVIPEGIHDLIDRVHVIRQSEPVGKPRQEKIIQMCRDFFNPITD